MELSENIKIFSNAIRFIQRHCNAYLYFKARKDISDRQEEKKKMDQNKQCKAKTEQKGVKKGDGIPDKVKGVVAASAKRPEMNDPTALRTESDEEDVDPIEGWKPPSKEEEENARRAK